METKEKIGESGGVERKREKEAKQMKKTGCPCHGRLVHEAKFILKLRLASVEMTIQRPV